MAKDLLALSKIEEQEEKKLIFVVEEKVVLEDEKVKQKEARRKKRSKKGKEMKMLEDQEKGADFRLTGIKSSNQPYLTKFIFSF